MGRMTRAETESKYLWCDFFVWWRHPLCIAAEKGDAEKFQELLDEGCHPGIGDNKPLVLACKHGHMRIVEILLDDWTLNASYPSGEPMLEAIKAGHLDICLYLYTNCEAYWHMRLPDAMIEECAKKFPRLEEAYALLASLFKAADKKEFTLIV
jgi:Ankyrin repeats (3 copies)